jgi:hypothetical protein
MTEEKGSTMVDLLKYPLLVFSILFALLLARSFLGLEFGAVTEVSTGGVKFAEKSRATFDALTTLEVKVNQALAELAELKKDAPAAESPALKTSIFAAGQVVSDQTARVEQIDVADPSRKGRLKGYVWIGNFKTGWNSPMLAQLDTGQPVTAPPTGLQVGTEYTVLGNMVVRDGLPANDKDYYKARSSVGVVPRGTRVRLATVPTAIDREYAVQYWAEIEVVGSG